MLERSLHALGAHLSDLWGHSLPPPAIRACCAHARGSRVHSPNALIRVDPRPERHLSSRFVLPNRRGSNLMMSTRQGLRPPGPSPPPRCPAAARRPPLISPHPLFLLLAGRCFFAPSAASASAGATTRTTGPSGFPPHFRARGGDEYSSPPPSICRECECHGRARVSAPRSPASHASPPARRG